MITKFLKNLIVAIVLNMGCLPALGFSLVGPTPPWLGPVTATCYDEFAVALDEEYRVNYPSATFGFTSDFVTFFGQRGMEEIRKCFEILNGLPTADQINPDDYPLETFRINHRARALGLMDIRTVAFQNILIHLGLNDPLAYVYAPRDQIVATPPPSVLDSWVTVRNYDPITYRQSPFVNGVLYTAQHIPPFCPIVFPVDPAERLFPRYAPLAASFSATTAGGFTMPGVYANGLTKDDAGALRYLYHTKNYNFETVQPGTTASPTPGNALLSQSSSSGGSSAGIYDFPLTSLFGGSGFYDSAVTLTNIVGNNTQQTGGSLGSQPASNTTATNAFINPAPRPGVGKIQWTETNYDSLLGEFFTPIDVPFADTVVTNGAVRAQRLFRNISQPDFVFDAKDLQEASDHTPNDPPTYTVIERLTINMINSDTIDGEEGDDDGPGIIGGMRLTYNTITPWTHLTLGLPVTEGFLQSNPNSFGEYSLQTWGAFNGSSDEPVIFPIGSELEQLESLVRGSN